MPRRKLQSSDYVHLHNHTQYSLLDGLTRIGPLIDFVKDKGMEAVAMTDHGTLSGAIDFYKEATGKGIKPIIGIETYMAARKLSDKEAGKDKQRFHLILLAMNNKGYENLMRLSTIANLEGFYYFPRIDRDTLQKYSEGVICLSACMGSEIGNALKRGQREEAKDTALWYKSVFGDRYYLEVQDHGHPKNPQYSEEQGQINKQILELSAELNIPSVVTCDAHYLKHEDQDAHEILLCVGTGSFLSDEKRMSLKEFPLHVTPPNEIIERWGDQYPDVVTNSKAIADRCNIEIELGKILIPTFEIPESDTEKTYLDKLVYRGLVWRYTNKEEEETLNLSVTESKKLLAKEVLDRAEYELSIIDNMGFNGYFLIIQDFIIWGKSQGIVFGPGRGSAAGSIIAYALKITELDPLEYDLLFERFLNPDRISMPDVDIDIQDTRRDEVIQYCIEKYGKEKVANIVTFGRMFARNAVRDVARVLEVPYADADRLAKMIPAPVQGRHIPLEKSLQENADLKAEYEENPTAKKVLDQAVILEGTIRSHGVHAAGVVIAPDDIVKFVPLEMAQKGVVSTQYPMGPVEDLGLLKMDFLGLSNLTTIKNTLRIIKKVYGKDIDIDRIPLDDGKAFELLQHGDTTGVFQLESAGMRRYLKSLKPTDFEDIIAMVALYRPGPMQFIDDFINRKHGNSVITFPHPTMKPALENTYGILVYQEQVMQISKEVCGFTGGEADTLRKAIGKKKADLMAKMKDKMIEGGQKHSGIDEAFMKSFWKQLEDFAAYCFNKSHAACYALIAYQTAYLKAHYPSAFMAALMTSDYDDIDRLAIEIAECRHMNIDVLPPNVNESFVEFAVVPKTNQVRFGLAAIKNVGRGAVEEILRARKQEGQFNTLEQFFETVNTRIVNRKALESLIKTGAFDGFGKRHTLLANIDVLLAYASRIQKERASGQVDLFGNTLETSKPQLQIEESTHEVDPREPLQWERDLLGLYISQHPLDSFKTILEEKTVPLNALSPEHDGKSVTAGGIITDVREITTKNGKSMAFVKIEDAFAERELVLFPGIYQETTGIWERDKIALVRGKVNAKDREGNITEDVKILVDDGREVTIEQAKAYQSTGKKARVPKKGKASKKVMAVQSAAKPTTAEELRLYIRIEKSDDSNLLLRLKETLDQQKGDHEVVLVLGPAGSKQILRLPMRASVDEEYLGDVKKLVGATNVKVQ